MNKFVKSNEITSKDLLDLESALRHEDDSALIFNIQTNQILLAIHQLVKLLVTRKMN